MRYLLLLIISYLYIHANAHIFVYHRFGDEKHKSTNTSIQELKKEFEYFKKNNYKVVKLSQIIDKINNNEEVPSNWVALTIDDAYKSFYQNGLEIFKEYGYPFSLYVYVEATDKHYRDFMSWDEIKEASKYGEIGLHSYSHPRLLNLSDEEIRLDTKKAYEKFTQKLGFKPLSYAYPYGEYDKRVENVIKEFNFNTILSQSTGSVSKDSNVYEIYRIALVGDVNIKQKLKYTTLNATWYEPKEFPKDGILKKVKVKVNTDKKNLKLYITGLGWRDIKVKDGIINLDLNEKLKKSRTRIIIGTDFYNITNHIIIKEKNNVK